VTKPILITIDGRTQGISGWARELGLNASKISRRIQKGWDPVEAVQSEGRAEAPGFAESRAVEKMVGQRFGQLVVLEPAGVNEHDKRLWRCQCDCGQETIAITGQLTSGRTRSCGHLQAQRRAAGNPKHGGRFTKAYQAWSNMKTRCDNPETPQYRDWGGRGITYDPQWAKFENFYADMGDPPDGMELDRISNEGPYSKDNCRYATRSEQRRNTREIDRHGDNHLRLITINGRTQCLQDWCTEYGITMSSVWKREKAGMTVVEALTKPKTNWNGR
jgi:hypothetical protein